MNQTTKKLKRFTRNCREFIYWYKFNRWIDNYDIITCIRLIHSESDNNELTTETLVNLEVQIERMTEAMGKSQPWKAFKILVNTAIKACKNE